MQIAPPSDTDIARLAAFLADPKRPGGTFTYHDLRGFLFSIATAPVLVRPSEWIPAIFDGKEAGYRDLAEARTITGALMGCYSQTVQAARHADHIQPADVGMDTSSDDALRLWARGFITGFEYLGDEWDVVVEELDDAEHEDFLAAYLDLTVWVDPKRCQVEYEIDDAALAEMLDSCREPLPD